MKKFILIILNLFLCISISAQNDAEREIYKQAEESYKLGHLDNTVTLLEENLRKTSSLFKINALRLLALCYLEQDKTDKAGIYVSQLLKEDPYYNITLNDPPRFIDMVEQFKKGETAVITTASQQAESLSEVPVPVTLITEEMIRQSGARTLADLLSLYVPGMSVVEGFETNMAMHGVYSTLQEKILVMQDGHRLNSRTNNSEAFDYRTSLDKIKQIEVLRGPASCLYGNVALTAVVNIITKNGNDVDGVKASLGVGNNHSYRADFLMGKRAMGIDFMGWGSVYSSEGEKRNVNVDDEEFYGKILIPGKMYIDGYNHRPAYDLGFSAKWKGLTLMFSMQEAKRVNPYNLLMIKSLYNYNRYRKYDNMKPGHSRKSTRFDLSYNKMLNEHWNFKLSAFLDLEDCMNYDIGGDTIPVEDQKLPVPPMEVVDHILIQKGVFQIQSWSDYTYGVTSQANYLFNLKKLTNSFLVGMHLENYTSNDNKMLLGDAFDRVLVTYSSKNNTLKTGRELNISPFIQLKTKFSNGFIINGGIRLDGKRRYDGRWLTELSPRLSLIYKLKTSANFKLSYAHSFVDAPFFYRGNSAKAYQGGTDLKPEKNDAVQLTFEGSIKENKIKYQSNMFYNRLKDLIFRKTKPRIYNNAGSLEVFGFEQILSGKFRRSNVYLNFTYQRVLNSTNYVASGAFVNNVPSCMLNAWYSCQVIKHRKFGNLNINFVMNAQSKEKSPIVKNRGTRKGEIFVDKPFNELGARAILNLGISYSYKKFMLSSYFYNLLNKDYYQGGEILPFPQLGINHMTKISYKF